MTTFKIKFEAAGDVVEVHCPYSEAVVQILRGLGCARWNTARKVWCVPVSRYGEAREALKNFPCVLSGELPQYEMATEPPPPPVDPAFIERALGAYQFKTKPYEHQRTAVALAVVAKAFGLFMEMGTGKTKTTIDALSLWMQTGAVGGALIVCPKAVLLTWEREIAAHSPLPPEQRRVCLLRGAGKDKRAALEQGMHMAQFFVTNYATFLQDDVDLRGLVRSKRLAVVLDESTNIKSHTAKTTRAALRVGAETDYKLILSGTPYTQGPLDAFAQFAFLDSNITGHHNFFSFKAEFAITGGFQGREIVGYKNLDRLAQRLKDHNYRVLKKDCLDLPEKVYRTVEVEAGPKQRAIYNEMKKESIVEIEGSSLPAPVVLTKMLRLQQITAGFLPKLDEHGKQVGVHQFENPKLDAVVELVGEAVDGGAKVIVWCRFVHELHQLELALSEHGVVTYYGEVPDAKRQANVDAFQTDPSVRVFIGQIQTGGIAITLTAASVEIYVSNTFALADRLQSEDRAHRIGQRSNVLIIDVLMRGTLDAYVLRTLRDKKSLADVITGDSIREIVGNA